MGNLQQCVHSSLVGLDAVFSINTAGTFLCPAWEAVSPPLPVCWSLAQGFPYILYILLPSGAVATCLKAHGWLQTQLDLATEIGCKLRDKPLSLCILVPKKAAKGKRDAVSKARQPLGD